MAAASQLRVPFTFRWPVIVSESQHLHVLHQVHRAAQVRADARERHEVSFPAVQAALHAFRHAQQRTGPTVVEELDLRPFFREGAQRRDFLRGAVHEVGFADLLLPERHFRGVPRHVPERARRARHRQHPPAFQHLPSGDLHKAPFTAPGLRFSSALHSGVHGSGHPCRCAESRPGHR